MTYPVLIILPEGRIEEGTPRTAGKWRLAGQEEFLFPPAPSLTSPPPIASVLVVQQTQLEAGGHG